MSNSINAGRRRVLGASLSIVATPLLMGAAITPRQTTGPFYPLELPSDHDNDLTKVEGQNGAPEGEITHVVGRVTDTQGNPAENALVEIWQVNGYGRYHHPRDSRDAPLDPNFQGYGRMLTNSEGQYDFRTIRPVPYPGRTPHIHFAVQRQGFRPLVTQMYIEGEPQNETDGLLNSIGDPEVRGSLIIPLARSKEFNNALMGRFDIVVPA